MPRKRPKTAEDLPTYRKPALPPLAVPEHLEPFLAGIELRRIVEKYGVDNIQLILGVLAEQTRREMIDRRRRETFDAWQVNMRPLAAATIASPPSLKTSEERRATSRYRRHRQEGLDFTIRKQARVRELEIGLAIKLEREQDSWHRRELIGIVNGVKAGMTVAQIARELGCSASTVEHRLAEIRNAAVVAAEAEQLAIPCPASGQNEGLGTNAPVKVEG